MYCKTWGFCWYRPSTFGKRKRTSKKASRVTLSWTDVFCTFWEEVFLPPKKNITIFWKSMVGRWTFYIFEIVHFFGGDCLGGFVGDPGQDTCSKFRNTAAWVSQAVSKRLVGYDPKITPFTSNYKRNIPLILSSDPAVWCWNLPPKPRVEVPTWYSLWLVYYSEL